MACPAGRTTAGHAGRTGAGRSNQAAQPEGTPSGWALCWDRRRLPLVVEVVAMVSDRGGRYGFVYKSRQDVYRALRRHGMAKRRAAQISNAGRTYVQRSRMARKAARTRRVRYAGRR